MLRVRLTHEGFEALLVVQLANVGAPLNFAPSTSARVASPEWVWVTLNTAPPNLPVCVLDFLPLCLAS